MDTKNFDGILNFIIELWLPYTEMRAVQFITHVSFMLERIVRGEKLAYKNINEKPLNIVSKHMMVYTDQFGINIPQEELIYITEIFLNWLHRLMNYFGFCVLL